MNDYAAFLELKRPIVPSVGIPCNPDDLHPAMKPHQRLICAWAIRKGRAAVWADTGLGKALIALEWARQLGQRTLILAPLSVAQQFVREGEKWGIPCVYAKSEDDAPPTGIVTSNYERLDRFDASKWGAIILDESSILANWSGETKRALIRTFRDTRYKLACTATPAPNDVVELCNHADFLGVMQQSEMMARFFTPKGVENSANGNYRVKPHARKDFFSWLASWAVACKRPSDLDCPDDGYLLPPLEILAQIVPTDWAPAGQLFLTKLKGVVERAGVRRDTITERVSAAARLVEAEPDQPWLLWYGLLSEAAGLERAIPGSVVLRGADTAERKDEVLSAFSRGELPVLVTYCSIAGLGMNFQACSRMAFVGLSDCYDEETEVLTDEGWKSFGVVSPDDQMATINPETLAFEWQNPTRVIWEPYTGPMVKFSGQRNFDLLVTPNHKLFVQRCPIRFSSTAGQWHLRSAYVVADFFRRQEYRMLSAARSFAGPTPEYVDIPSFSQRRPSTRSRIVTQIEAEDFMRLAGWYLSEGYCRPIDSGERGRIVICQTDHNPEYREEIIALMERIGLHVNSRTKDITGYSTNLAADLLEQFGHSSEMKRIPWWIKNLDGSLLMILRDTMLKGDGQHPGARGTSRCYTSFSTKLRDDFQEICLKTGVRASVKDKQQAVALAWENTTPAIHQEPETVEYSGMIGCVTVPNHVVIVRRNGIPVVSGNSYQAYYQAIRRCWRFGQTNAVHAHIVLSEPERAVYENVLRKEREAHDLTRELVAALRDYERAELYGTQDVSDVYTPTRRIVLPPWLRSVTSMREETAA